MLVTAYWQAAKWTAYTISCLTIDKTYLAANRDSHLPMAVLCIPKTAAQPRAIHGTPTCHGTVVGNHWSMKSPVKGLGDDRTCFPVLLICPPFLLFFWKRKKSLQKEKWCQFLFDGHFRSWHHFHVDDVTSSRCPGWIVSLRRGPLAEMCGNYVEMYATLYSHSAPVQLGVGGCHFDSPKLLWPHIGGVMTLRLKKHWIKAQPHILQCATS